MTFSSYTLSMQLTLNCYTMEPAWATLTNAKQACSLCHLHLLPQLRSCASCHELRQGIVSMQGCALQPLIMTCGGE